MPKFLLHIVIATLVVFSYQAQSQLRQPILNITDFGAKPGSSKTEVNDRAFETAMSSLSKTGGTLSLPGGVFCISRTIRIPSHVTIIGEKDGSTILKMENPGKGDVMQNRNFDFIAGNGAGDKDIHIKNVGIDGNKDKIARITEENIAGAAYHGQPLQAGIQFAKVTESSIENCRIYDCPWSGIAIAGASDILLYNVSSNDNGNNKLPAFAQFEAMGVLIWDVAYRGGSNEKVTIRKVTASRNQKHGIEIFGRGNKDHVVDSCIGENNNAAGIVYNSWAGSKEKFSTGSISNSFAQNNATGGISIAGTNITLRKSVVEGNGHCILSGGAQFVTKQISSSAVTCSGYGNRISELVIKSNLPSPHMNVLTSEIRGITADGEGHTIYNNQISNCDERGIVISGKDIKVIGNKVSYTGLGKTTSGLGIQVSDGFNVIVDSNYISFAKDNGLYVQNSSTVYLRNNKISNSGRIGIEVYNIKGGRLFRNESFDNGLLNSNVAVGIRIYNCNDLQIEENNTSDRGVNKRFRQAVGLLVEGNNSHLNIKRTHSTGNSTRNINILSKSPTVISDQQ